MTGSDTSTMTDFSRLVPERVDAVVLARRTPMQHHIWLRACAETLYPEAALIALEVAGGAAGPRALGAFARSKGFPAHLFLLGAEELGEPGEVLFQTEADAQALASAFKATGLAGRFGHYPAQSAFVAALKKAFSSGGYVATAPTRGSPFIALDESWRDPIATFNSRRRSDFRRMQRKAEALGEMKIEILTPGPHEAEALLDEAIAVEAKSWKARAGTALDEDEKIAAFFRRYVMLASEQRILRIAFLRIDGEAIAMQIAVECDNAFWLFKIGYDEAFGQCSPGNLLMLETVKYAAEKGLATFEFLGKSAPWTKFWTQTERPNTRLRVYPYTLQGLVALGIDGLSVAIKRIKEKLTEKPEKPDA